jgi:hypothetical protein
MDQHNIFVTDITSRIGLGIARMPVAEDCQMGCSGFESFIRARVGERVVVAGMV